MPAPGKRRRSTTWLIALVAVAAIGAFAVFTLLSMLGVGPRDERSYQVGREEGENGGVFIKFGNMTPEEFCDNRFHLRTPFNQKSDVRRSDFMTGCLDALNAKSTNKS